MNTTEFRNPHTAEVAHDTKLLELLYDELRANNTAAGMARRLVEFAGEHRDDKVHTVYGRTRVVKVRATGAKLTLGAAVELVEEFADEARRVEASIAELAAELINVEGLSWERRLLLGNGIVGLAEGACRYWVTNDVEVDAATLAAQVSQLAWAGLRGVG